MYQIMANIILDGLTTDETTLYRPAQRIADKIDAEINNFKSKKKLSKLLEELCFKGDNDQKHTLTIFCHGYDDGLLLGKKKTTKIQWKTIAKNFYDLKIKYSGLIIILCVCEGSSIGTVVSGKQFIFGFPHKVSFGISIDVAVLIIDNYLSDIELNQIVENADQLIKEREKFIKLS